MPIPFSGGGIGQQIASLFVRVGANTADLHKGLADVDKALGRSKQNMMTMQASVGALAASFALVAGASKLIWETSKQGAMMQRAEKSFEMMAGGASEAAKTLDIMREATRNAVPDIELMTGATNILALGLAEDAQQLGEITRNITALGSRFGGNLQMFQLMMSNQSLRRIDSFGIGVGEATERIKEFTDAGMEAEEAFQVAVLELMNEKFVELGGAVEDNALAFEQLETNLKNISNAMKMQAAEAVGPLVARYNDFVEETIAGDKALIGFAATLRMVNTVMGTNENAFYAYQIAAIEAKDATKELSDSSMDVGVGMRDMAKAGQDAGKGIENIGKKAGVSLGLIGDSSIAFGQYNDALLASESAVAAFIAAQDVIQKEAFESRNAFLEAAGAMRDMSEQQLGMEIVEMLEGMKEAGVITKEQFLEAKQAALEVFGVVTAGETEFLTMMQEAVALSGEFPGGFYEAFLHILAAKQVLDEMPETKTIRVRIEETIIRAGWQGPVYSPGILDPDIPVAPTSSTGGGGSYSSTWSGNMNISGASNPQATAAAVIQKLQDRGIIRGGGYR